MSLQEILVPFPQRLMSTARAPDKMPTEFARELRNFYARQDGAGRRRNGCSKVGAALADNIVRLMHYVTPTGTSQLLAVTDAGKIHLQNGSSWAQVYAGLNPTGTVRWTHFAGKLLICNGVNDVLVWDGSTCAPVSELVVDMGSSLTYVAANTFTIASDAALYPVGSVVRAKLASGYVTSTVSSVSGTGTVTVTLATGVLNSTLSEVAYTAKPPQFQFMLAAHDRLWGFGKGPLQATGLSNNPDRSRVYYTQGVNDETAWHNESGEVPSINLADKMPLLDELMAMAVKDGVTGFFFKNHIQLWTGSDPTVSGDFTWSKTLPMGVIHGDLVVNLPNDVGFLNRLGARTLSRSLQTEQLDVGDFGAEIAPTVADAMTTLLANAGAYAQAQSFRHDGQGWFGFKLGGMVLVFQLVAGQLGWAVFDGLFATASCFLNGGDGELYLAKNGQVYRYDEQVWADDGTPYTSRWWTPWLNVGTFKRWANKAITVLTDQGLPLGLTLQRYKNYNSQTYAQTQTSATVAASYWDADTWDTALWDTVAPQPERERDAFVADVFAYALECNATQGPLTVFGVKVEGVREV